MPMATKTAATSAGQRRWILDEVPDDVPGVSMTIRTQMPDPQPQKWSSTDKKWRCLRLGSCAWLPVKRIFYS